MHQVVPEWRMWMLPSIQLLADSKPACVLMAQVRQPLSDQNGRERQAHCGLKPPVDEMGVAELRQEVAENHTRSTNCERTRSHSSGSDVTAGKEAGVGRTIRQPSNWDPRLESTCWRGLPRDPSLSRSRPPRFKPTCCGPAGDHPTQIRS